MVEVKMLVDEAYASLLKAGIDANIVTRRSDGTLRKFVKCHVLSNEKITSDASDGLINAIFNVSNKNSVDIGNLRKSMADVKKGIGNLTNITKDMAVNVDQIFKATNITKTLSYLNLGMTMANMAVDIAGFVIVCNKINELGGKVQELSEKIDRCEIRDKNNLIKDSKNFALKSNLRLDMMAKNEEMDLRELGDLVTEYSNHLGMLVNGFIDNSVDSSVSLMLINYIIPSYTTIVSEFLERYYYKYCSMPSGLSTYMYVFDALASSDYISKLEDYYFFDEKLSTIDTMDAVNAQILLGLNGRIQIEDQIQILKTLQNKENVEEFKRKLEEYAKLKFEEDINELYNSSEEWKTEIEMLRAS